MKKRSIILCAAGALALIIAGSAAIVTMTRRAQEAAAGHGAIHAAYTALYQQAEALTVTVTEHGVPVGTYDLAALGVLPETLRAIDAAYSASERMTPDEFAARSLRERLSWHDEVHTGEVQVPVVMDGFTAAPVLADLQEVSRTPSEDAFVSFEDAAYTLHPEVPGNELREDVVADALLQQLSALVVAQDEQNLTFEVTDLDCYVPPEVTVENGGFDFQENLARDLQSLRITATFMNGEEVLAGDDIAGLVSVGADGKLAVDRAALNGIIAGWAAAHNLYNTPYLFDSYVDGVVPIEFLLRNYEIQASALAEAITGRILALDSGTCTAVYDCFDEDGNEFSIENTYIEVDIQNQHLAYYIDGELQVATDVVTGRPRGRETPTGLYSSYDRRGNRWLIGSDYAVYVKYWVRIFGNYGLHDASWRDEFGGDLYIQDGSHGCVNIPEAAMAVIYEKIVDGTPVLVF